MSSHMHMSSNLWFLENCKNTFRRIFSPILYTHTHAHTHTHKDRTKILCIPTWITKKKYQKCSKRGLSQDGVFSLGQIKDGGGAIETSLCQVWPSKKFAFLPTWFSWRC